MRITPDISFDGLCEINGAPLYCKVRGKGDALLLIHGAGVDSDFFEEAACALAQHHTVITYDRRGYSRSGGTVTGSILEQSAKDAAEIIRCFAPDSKVTVAGCSMGALVAMKLAEQYPELISLAVLHEPPTVAFLPKEHEALRTVEAIRGFIVRGRFGRAANEFALAMYSAEENAKPKGEKVLERQEKNMRFFAAFEFSEIFSSKPPPAIPKEVSTIFCAGDAHREDLIYQTTAELAKRTGRPFVRIAGKHNCANELPTDFSVAIEGICKIFKP